jgi:hypothetical protein
VLFTLIRPTNIFKVKKPKLFQIYKNYLTTYHFVRDTVNNDGPVLGLPQLLLLIGKGQERIIHPSREVTRNHTRHIVKRHLLLKLEDVHLCALLRVFLTRAALVNNIAINIG